MIVEVLFYDPLINGYAGERYTYYCNIPVLPGQKVLAPVKQRGDIVLKNALIMATDLPESVIKDEWRSSMKTITQLDNGY